MMTSRRMGKFYVSAYLIDSNPETLRAIMGCCIVVRAELLFDRNEIQYVALCERFDVIQPYDKTPLYRWICTRDDTLGQVTVAPARIPAIPVCPASATGAHWNRLGARTETL